ncbi:hypothetical protein WMY93_015764 [Mugilogobius chulae]|uniref:non-specific serine/threonine protein kinase n=1 Tax=Mugilogobius chulae TaxID=88201 RepID=A0AAW0NS21_9GOBI
MPVVSVNPPAAEDMVAEGGDAEGQEHRAAPLPLVKVSREMLRSFPHSKRVGSYLVGKMINKGSFAKVMEGLHIGTGEKVAIKVIDKKKARQDSYVLKNMKREPRIHQMVRHPHIVVLFETLETENSYYMSMELCAGGDLMDRICERKRLEEREVRRYTRQILSAVDHLHKHGIVHRDLKIENFLLDEHNNIKIVDFGLSNTLKPESLSVELLNTQCGSPAYAAPELLAHRKYGPKVDVWSVGVSTFAMLTGTLPFTVEPFNIKHLHQKMINGEISSIPSDVSKGAVSFVLSLLEPDPAKRPSIRAAMEERWVNEGYGKKGLASKNRLCAEDLNSSVLSYMTDTLGYSLSDIIHTLTNNRPSPIMAYYHLLLSKFNRSQKGAKTIKKSENDWTLPSKNTWRERNGSEAKGQQKNAQTPKQSSRSQRPAAQAERETVKEQDENQPPALPSLPHLPHPSSPLCPHVCPPHRPLLWGRRGGAGLSVFRERELVHLSPPKSSASQLCDSAPCQVTSDPVRTGSTTRPARHAHLLRTTRSDGAAAADPASDCFQDNRHHEERLEKLQTFYNTDPSPVILDADLPPSDRERMETAPSPLPRLRNIGLKDSRGRKMTWLTRPGPSGLLVNGSKPPAVLRQDRGKRRELSVTGGAGVAGDRVGGGMKRNSVQLRASLQRGLTDLNLPLLPPALQKQERKNRLHGMDY